MTEPLPLHSLNRDVLGLILAELSPWDLAGLAQMSHFWQAKIGKMELYQQAIQVLSRPNDHFQEATRKGYRELAHWIYQQKRPFISVDEVNWIQQAEQGNLAMLTFLHSIYMRETLSLASFDQALALQKASFHGHFEVVKFLLWIEDFFSTRDLSRALFVASERNHLEIVRFLLTRTTFHLGHLSHAFYVAAIGGHLEILKYLHSQAPEIDPLSRQNSPNYEEGEVLRITVEHGHLHVLEWIWSITPDITSYAYKLFASACAHSDFQSGRTAGSDFQSDQIARWLLTQVPGLPWQRKDHRIFRRALADRNRPILRFLLSLDPTRPLIQAEDLAFLNSL